MCWTTTTSGFISESHSKDDRFKRKANLSYKGLSAPLLVRSCPRGKHFNLREKFGPVMSNQQPITKKKFGLKGKSDSFLLTSDLRRSALIKAITLLVQESFARNRVVTSCCSRKYSCPSWNAVHFISTQKLMQNTFPKRYISLNRCVSFFVKSGNLYSQ